MGLIDGNVCRVRSLHFIHSLVSTGITACKLAFSQSVQVNSHTKSLIDHKMVNLINLMLLIESPALLQCNLNRVAHYYPSILFYLSAY